MRRTRSGGGKPLSNNDRILRRHIEAAGINYSASTVEDLVDNLRSCYPNYARRKLQPFTKQVERVIVVSSRRNDAMDESDADDGDTLILKKRRKINDRDEKLQLIEAEHGRHQNGDVTGSGGGGSSSSLLASAMMQPKELGEERAAREAVELEVVDSNKVVKEVNLMNGEPKLCGNLNKNDCSNNVVNRPMFKDLGGMRGVMEDLEMDVLLPLYHPQLLRHLVVKPVVGILLHGPPGCGKTRLAHAIANETGVPFYKVSATELVSGVSGESEKSIRELFSQASRTAPSIVFIDEIDAEGNGEAHCDTVDDLYGSSGW